jgi:hypothetical protein
MKIVILYLIISLVLFKFLNDLLSRMIENNELDEYMELPGYLLCVKFILLIVSLFWPIFLIRKIIKVLSKEEG